MTRTHILLADDHDLFREGLAGLINAEADLQVVGQARDGFEALTLARDLCPDLIVMDISMPTCDGLEATRLIRARWPEARVVILTIHDEDAKLFQAIRAGACGYILKSTNSADFLRGVRSALAGEATLPPKLAARLVEEFARMASRSTPEPPPSDLPDLTFREREVLGLIATSATDKEIAAQLSISLYTAKTHVRNILGKLHASNRREAAQMLTRKPP